MAEIDEAKTLRLWTLSEQVVGACIEVHRHLGPGLLESAYETCLCYELEKHGLKLDRQRQLSVRYKTVNLDCCYRLDIVVEDVLLVELKAATELQSIHSAQVLTYLKLAQLDVGLLVNFNSQLLKSGLRRFVRPGANIGLSPTELRATKERRL